MDRVAVEADNLTKRYGSGTLALDRVTFAVATGETFGLLGANGAGKTTTVRILVTLLTPTSGTARVGGHDVVGDSAGVRRCIGYSAQAATVDALLTVSENLKLAARLHGLDRKGAGRRAAEVAERLGLEAVRDQRAGVLSGGMRRRLDLAQALVHRPEVLFLDEPTTGLDPEARRGLWGELQRLQGEGVTIVLTTQYLEEADRLCGRVAILHDGVLAAWGTPAELKSETGRQVVTVTLPADATVADTTRAAAVLGGLRGALAPMVSHLSVAVPFANDRDHLPGVTAALEKGGIRAASMVAGPPTLDDVYLRHVATPVGGSEGQAEPHSVARA